jgi:hypothetical protein
MQRASDTVKKSKQAFFKIIFIELPPLYKLAALLQNPNRRS